jgi:ketosteroid isomerase-like protein
MRVNRCCLPIVAFSATLLIAGASLAGASAGDVPPGVIISGRTKVKPKPKLVRHALEARYAEIAEAYRVKNPDVVLRMRTEDFHAIMPSGEAWDATTSAQYTRAGFAQVESTLALTFELGIIDVQGDTAAAEIDQHWVRRQQKAGALRHVDTRAHQRETWLQRNGAWLLWRVDHVQPGTWIVDGKRIDPSKPYDPKAPAYEAPEDER